MELLKNNIKVFIGIIIGMIISGSIVYAVQQIDSADVTYNPSDSNFDVSNVKSALDSLYDQVNANLTIEKIYERSILNGTGENLNINYTIPTGVKKITLIIAREFAYCTFKTISITGDGLVAIKQSKRSSQGSSNPYNYLSIYELEVNPGGNINITTTEINMTTSGNYSSYVYAIY